MWKNGVCSGMSCFLRRFLRLLRPLGYYKCVIDTSENFRAKKSEASLR